MFFFFRPGAFSREKKQKTQKESGYRKPPIELKKQRNKKSLDRENPPPKPRHREKSKFCLLFVSRSVRIGKQGKICQNRLCSPLKPRISKNFKFHWCSSTNPMTIGILKSLLLRENKSNMIFCKQNSSICSRIRVLEGFCGGVLVLVYLSEMCYS